MFADHNRAFIAEQREGPGSRDHAMAARGADQLLADLGVAFRSLRYYFRIDAATYGTLVRATRVLVQAQEKLLRHLCATLPADAMVTMFRVPPEMASRIEWSEVASAGLRMVRADIIPTSSGYYFCELNHFSGVGGGEAYHSARALAELLGRPAAGVSPFRQLAHQYVTECHRAGIARVVILDSSTHRRLGFGEHRMLRRYLRLMAPELEVHYHDELTYPAQWLRPDEAGKTLIHRLVTLDDTTDGGAFLGRVRDSGAIFSCMFEAELKMHRKWFSLLWDSSFHHLLDDEELAVVRRFLPYSFDLRPDNLDAAVADKDRLVFKRSYSYGGEGVLIGDEHSSERLRVLLTEDISAWTVQQRLYTSTLDLPEHGRSVPFYFVLAMYLYGDAASGLLVRGSPGSSVVNVSQGGGVSWAFAE